jgi:hypothetical protein
MTHLIIVHEGALRADHPVFAAAGAESRAIFIWDEIYLKRAEYSLKRLVFMYETLCALPFEVVAGEMGEVIKTLSPTKIFVPETSNPQLRAWLETASAYAPITWVEDVPFVVLKKSMEPKRFFQYWNKAERSALLKNGGADA